MDIGSGLLKLERIINARKSLDIKLKDDPENQTIKDTIERHKATIAHLKDQLKFEERFEVKECQCDSKPIQEDVKPSVELPKPGDVIEEGQVVGVFIKVSPLNKDGSVSKQTRYIEIVGENA